MSTQVRREEWPQLIPVPLENYCWRIRDGWVANTLGLCDIDQAHGSGHHYWQTPDHRGLVLCMNCEKERADEASRGQGWRG